MGVVTAIWIHQWDRAGLSSWAQLREQWPGTVYVKALDGISWMADFDTGNLAVNTPGGAPTWQGRSWSDWDAVAWTVPRPVSIGVVGDLTEALIGAAGTVILDLEPYEHFWYPPSPSPYGLTYSLLAPGRPRPAFSIDYRRLPWPGSECIQFASRLLPQCYWTSFQRPWRDVLEEAAAALAPYGIPVEYVLPGDADPDDLRAALTWVSDHGATASIWLWQSITPANWEVLLADTADTYTSGSETKTLAQMADELHSAGWTGTNDQGQQEDVLTAYTRTSGKTWTLVGQTPPPADPTTADLINLVGYLQGDVATALESALGDASNRLIEADDAIAAAREAITAAHAALDTLRNAGK